MTLTVHSRIDQGPTTDVARIRDELSNVRIAGASYASPLAPYAQTIYDLGVEYNVDPAFFLAVAAEESLYGLSSLAGYPTSVWDPATGTGSYNWTSISDALYGGWPVSGSRWGQYPNIQAGIEAFDRLITAEYYPMGQRDLFSIWWGVGGSCNPCVVGQHAYGPCFENPCSGLDTVVAIMNRVAKAAHGGDGCPPNCPPPPPPPNCPYPTEYNPTSGACEVPPNWQPRPSIVPVLIGVGLLGVAAYVALEVA